MTAHPFSHPHPGLQLASAVSPLDVGLPFDIGLRTCRKCGCSEHDACWDEKHGAPCHWVEDDLCSACEDLAGGALAASADRTVRPLAVIVRRLLALALATTLLVTGIFAAAHLGGR